MGRKKQRKKNSQEMELNITSMMDMFTIILVFLLKSYSTDAETKLTPTDEIRLPTTIASSILEEDAPSVVITRNAILVNGKVEVAQIVNWDTETGESFYIIPGLLAELTKIADRQKYVAKYNTSVNFDGLIVVQADRDMPGLLLTKVMATIGQAEFSKIKLAAISKVD